MKLSNLFNRSPESSSNSEIDCKQDSKNISRRQFLTGGAAMAALAAIGCESNLPEGKIHQQEATKTEKNPQMPDIVESKLKPYPKDSFTEIPPIKLESKDQVSQMIELSKKWQKISEEAIALFADADPLAQNLLDFLKHSAFYSIPMGPKTTQAIFENYENTDDAMKRIDEGFEIVYMPEKYASSMPSSILTEPNGRTMRIATTFKSKEWLGIMLIHELSHVYDVFMVNENPHDKSQYLAGEVNAHLLEAKMLRSWNPAVYDKFMDEAITHWENNEIQPVIDLALKYYPLTNNEVSEREASLGLASCLTSVAFEQAMRRGATEKDLQQVYQHLVKMFTR
ncbi:twin-arginine translocation signal domain-containing protein [Candidatus Peregrinibacteria bacterium]|nr:twin-arginine translocation signal domain-containing protein [Candidatus Peregrinibacteria bacterium]